MKAKKSKKPKAGSSGRHSGKKAQKPNSHFSSNSAANHAKSQQNSGFTDIISISDFSRQDIEKALNEAALMDTSGLPGARRKQAEARKKQLLAGKTVACLFFEPSTRTRLSFVTAAQNLGASVIGFSETQTSSVSKGETFSDTIKMVENYADIIVVRHSVEGAPRRAAEISRRPIVNAGDGANQHPTQTLLDLYTMRKALGKIDGLRIALVGDLKYGRTVHSLMYAFSKFRNVTVYLISPKSLEMPRHIIEDTKDKLRVLETNNLAKYLREIDILYATRIQKERFPDEVEYEKVKNAYVITPELLANARPGLRVMHPLPRINEISTEIDATPAALYFEQAANGIPVREALLNMVKDVVK